VYLSLPVSGQITYGLLSLGNDLSGDISISTYWQFTANSQHFIMVLMSHVLMINKLYAIEKLGDTIDSLAVGKGRIKERLLAAYIRSLIHVDVKALPEEAQDMLLQVKAELTRVKPIGDEGSVKATLDTMSEDQAVELVNKILGIYYRTISIYQV